MRELAGPLAAETAPRLEITIMTPETQRQVLVMAMPLDCVVETLMVSMIVLTQIGEPQIWADWKHSRLLPLVVPALNEPEKALWWLLFQFLRFFFFLYTLLDRNRRLTLTLHKHERLFFSSQVSPP